MADDKPFFRVRPGHNRDECMICSIIAQELMSADDRGNISYLEEAPEPMEPPC